MATIYDYMNLGKIGEGTYGVVYKATNKQTGKMAALKEIRLNVGNGEGVPRSALGEISVLKELQHPNIVCLEDILYQDSKLYLVFEYMQMDLRNYLDTLPSGQNIDDKLLKSYTYQILQGTMFCHSRRILHRDLKPQNLLIDTKGAIKLADFGLGRTFGIPVRAYSYAVVTRWYRAPEVLLRSQRYSCPIDVWSVGCIYAEMARKIPIFPGDSEIDQLFRIFCILGTPDQTQWPGISELPYFNPNFPKWVPKDLNTIFPTLGKDGCDLLKQTLVYNPGKRISARAALLHPYFHDLDKSSLPSACH